MRIFSVIVLSIVVLGVSGCRMPRRTSNLPLVEKLYVQPVEKAKSLLTRNRTDATRKPCRIGGIWKRTVQPSQPVVLQGNQPHFETVGNGQLPIGQTPVVGGDCGCLPSEIVDYGNSQPVSEIAPITNETNPVSSAILDLEPETNIAPAAPKKLKIPSLDGELIPDTSQHIDPPSGLFETESKRNVTSRVARTSPELKDEPPRVAKVKALPVSAPRDNSFFESKPLPFVEMKEEEAKVEAVMELPASIETDKLNNPPIVLKAFSSKWHKEQRVDEKQIPDVGEFQRNNLLRQTGTETDRFGLPRGNDIPFTDLPPLHSVESPGLQFKQTPNRQSESLELPQNIGPLDQTTQTAPADQYYSDSVHPEPKSQVPVQVANTNATSISKDQFVVESTAIYQPQRTTATQTPNRILRLSAVTGSGSAKVDSRANVAIFKMESPIVVRGSYASEQSDVSRVAEERQNSTQGVLDR